MPHHAPTPEVMNQIRAADKSPRADARHPEAFNGAPDQPLATTDQSSASRRSGHREPPVRTSVVTRWDPVCCQGNLAVRASTGSSRRDVACQPLLR